MSDAERQRRRRDKLGIGGPYVPWRLPWDENAKTDWAQTKLLDELYHWMEFGDEKQVASWLAFHFDSARWEELSALVHANHQADEAEYEARQRVTCNGDGRG